MCHQEEGHMINQYEDFYNKMIRMLTQGTLRIEGDTGRKVSIVDELSKNKKVYKVQFTVNGLPKLIMYKPTMPCHIIMGIPVRSYNQCPFFKQKVGGLTRNGSFLP